MRPPTAARSSRADEAFFSATLSKDELPPGRATDAGTFVKHCADSQVADAEGRVLELLAQAPDGPWAPAPVTVRGALVEMELVSGIRAFELFHLLRGLQRAGTVPPETSAVLLRRMLDRLAVTQPLVTTASAGWATHTYPFDVKVTQLLGLLGRLLELPEPPSRLGRELDALEQQWNAAVEVPFMDRSLRNVLVVEPLLSVLNGDGRQRAARLARLLVDDPQWPHRVPFADIDFSSVTTLTTAEDDWVSLQLHEVTAWMCPSLDDLVLPVSADRSSRLGLGLLVRYLRFGGRKMAYSLMHPAGAVVRFGLDDAGFYARRLPELIARCAPEMPAEYPAVFARISDISAAFDATVRADPRADPWWGKRPLWSESPLEL